MNAKWLKFEDGGLSKSGKTKVWNVCTLEGQILGRIGWFGGWRKYSFYPGSDTVFEQDCLRDIADFCQAETRKHREAQSSKILERRPELVSNCGQQMVSDN